MGDVILRMAISIDGFVSDLDGTNRWMFGTDQQAKAWGVDLLWTGGLHIMGSRSFLAMAGYWQTSTDPFAAPMNQIPKAVFSKRGPAILDTIATTGPLQPGADSWAQTYVATGDLAEEIARLKAQNDKPIIAHGGVAFARSLVAAGLVDQFALYVAPVALGKGLALFSELTAPQPMQLLQSTAFPGGAVAQIYRPT